MRAHTMQTTDVTSTQLGWVLASDLYDRDGGQLLLKGTVLDTAALESMSDATPGAVHLLALEPDDVHEDAAGLRIARAVASHDIRVVGPMNSRYDLTAAHKGMLRVDAEVLRSINRVGDVTVYSLLDWQPVLPGTVLASVKITPIAIPETQVAAAERLCREAARPPLVLQPFLPKQVAVVVVDTLDRVQRAHFRSVIERKLRWFGAILTDLRFVAADTREVASAFEDFLHAGADILLAAGGNPIDPLDPVAQALPRVGAHLVHQGAPTRGSMFWLAQAGAVPIVNLAASRMYIGAAVGDVILPMLMTGHQVTRDDVIAIGYGGLPGSAIAFRFPPYD